MDLKHSLRGAKVGDIIVLDVKGWPDKGCPAHRTIGVVSKIDGGLVRLSEVLWCSLRGWRKMLLEGEIPLNLTLAWDVCGGMDSVEVFPQSLLVRMGKRELLRHVKLIADL